jgi:hypothetical protein
MGRFSRSIHGGGFCEVTPNRIVSCGSWKKLNGMQRDKAMEKRNCVKNAHGERSMGNLQRHFEGLNNIFR